MTPSASKTIASAAVEGDLDEAVLLRLAAYAGISIGPVFGRKGKPYLRKKIGGYNQAARFSPWIVLVDLDNDECAPSLRAEWIPNPSERMRFSRSSPRGGELAARRPRGHCELSGRLDAQNPSRRGRAGRPKANHHRLGKKLPPSSDSRGHRAKAGKRRVNRPRVHVSHVRVRRHPWTRLMATRVSRPSLAEPIQVHRSPQELGLKPASDRPGYTDG